ncbi:hypothetical protein BBP40_008796 [Aspergillus hancockii]|nr:hypothetical protein BBP40_008796 [Aspergillus hancockii]
MGTIVRSMRSEVAGFMAIPHRPFLRRLLRFRAGVQHRGVLSDIWASAARGTTGNWALRTEFEEWFGNITISYYFNIFGIRPVRMLLRPICFLVALHASFIFGVFYATLAAFPILFEQTWPWGPVIQSALNYLLDVFTRWGESAIAANTFLGSTLTAVY